MPTKEAFSAPTEKQKVADVERRKKSIAASDLAGKTKVSSTKVAMAFDRASRSTGAFTSKYAK